MNKQFLAKTGIVALLGIFFGYFIIIYALMSGQKSLREGATTAGTSTSVNVYNWGFTEAVASATGSTPTPAPGTTPAPGSTPAPGTTPTPTSAPTSASNVTVSNQLTVTNPIVLTYTTLPSQYSTTPINVGSPGAYYAPTVPNIVGCVYTCNFNLNAQISSGVTYPLTTIYQIPIGVYLVGISMLVQGVAGAASVNAHSTDNTFGPAGAYYNISKTQTIPSALPTDCPYQSMSINWAWANTNPENDLIVTTYSTSNTMTPTTGSTSIPVGSAQAVGGWVTLVRIA